MDEDDFVSVERSDTRVERVDKLCLAKVDAEILKAVGGVVKARELMRRDKGKKQRRAPKKERNEDNYPLFRNTLPLTISPIATFSRRS